MAERKDCPCSDAENLSIAANTGRVLMQQTKMSVLAANHTEDIIRTCASFLTMAPHFAGRNQLQSDLQRIDEHL